MSNDMSSPIETRREKPPWSAVTCYRFVKGRFADPSRKNL